MTTYFLTKPYIKTKIKQNHKAWAGLCCQGMQSFKKAKHSDPILMFQSPFNEISEVPKECTAGQLVERRLPHFCSAYNTENLQFGPANPKNTINYQSGPNYGWFF
ncbi:hypothetical protein AMECASPLE_017103, partial [Ameca splendens]